MLPPDQNKTRNLLFFATPQGTEGSRMKRHPGRRGGGKAGSLPTEDMSAFRTSRDPIKKPSKLQSCRIWGQHTRPPSLTLFHLSLICQLCPATCLASPYIPVRPSSTVPTPLVPCSFAPGALGSVALLFLPHWGLDQPTTATPVYCFPDRLTSS